MSIYSPLNYRASPIYFPSIEHISLETLCFYLNPSVFYYYSYMDSYRITMVPLSWTV